MLKVKPLPAENDGDAKTNLRTILKEFNLANAYDFIIIKLNADTGTEATLSLAKAESSSKVTTTPEQHYGKFVSYMKENFSNECCYAFVNTWYYKNGNLIARMAMVAWIPDDCSERADKMKYTSAKKEAMVRLDQQTCHQANDFEDLEWKNMLAGNGVKDYDSKK